MAAVLLRVYKTTPNQHGHSMYHFEGVSGTTEFYLVVDDLVSRAERHRKQGDDIRISFDPPCALEFKGTKHLVAYTSLDAQEQEACFDRLKKLLG